MDSEYKYKYQKLINNSFMFLIFLFIFTIPNNAKDNSNIFHKLIKLTSDEFFIILDSGIYLYDSNFTSCKTLYIFQGNEKIISKEDSINTLISEIANNDKYYAIALAKKYIYIYNCTGNSLTRYFLNKLNDYKADQKGVNYNLIPYEINNIYIKFIISHLYDNTPQHKMYFYFYTINFLQKSIICEE